VLTGRACEITIEDICNYIREKGRQTTERKDAEEERVVRKKNMAEMASAAINTGCAVLRLMLWARCAHVEKGKVFSFINLRFLSRESDFCLFFVV